MTSWMYFLILRRLTKDAPSSSLEESVASASVTESRTVLAVAEREYSGVAIWFRCSVYLKRGADNMVFGSRGRSVAREIKRVCLFSDSH